MDLNNIITVFFAIMIAYYLHLLISTNNILIIPLERK